MARDDVIFIGVFKDLGSESVVAPSVWEAYKRGHETYFVVEGKGGGRFRDTYVKYLCNPEHHFTKPLEVTFCSDDFEKRPFKIDMQKYILNCVWDAKGRRNKLATLIGESSPINLERKVGQRINSLNREYFEVKHCLHLVVCQDFWGSSSIVAPDIKPHLVLSIDEYGKELTLETYRHLNEKDVVVVGNPGVKMVELIETVREQYISLANRFGTVYYFAGGGAETAEQLHLLKKCLDLTRGDWCLVVGYPPKLVEQYGGEWWPIVAGLGERVIEAAPGTGDQWGAIAPVTISGASTIMTTAVYSGNVAVCLQTPETLNLFDKRKMDKVPQVALGIAHCVTEPLDMSEFVGWRPESNALAKLKPHDPIAAYEAVMKLFG